MQNATARDFLKEQSMKIRSDIQKAKQDNQNMKTFQSTMNYNKAKEAKSLENYNRNQYNQSVSESHNQRATEFLQNKEMHGAKIRQLEEA